ncbi:MAG: homogentisate 1,2-dioxygenase [Actinomycetota bacterium]|nr:homogentisate 1,2-dioxygenase [Actinomycetota bacterium]
MADFTYQTGFGNHFESEADPGVLPVGQNSPQRVKGGLYTEQITGTAFTAPRSSMLRSWVYRMRPSVRHFTDLQPIDNGLIRSGPDQNAASTPVQLRWDPFPASSVGTNWLTGLTTVATNGNNEMQLGGAVHHFVATNSMQDLAFVNTDGELMLVPYDGRLVLRTEMGNLHVAPGYLAVIPRGVKFSVDLLDATARGYVCENYGTAFGLPEHGLLGPDANALPRDFEYPIANYDRDDNPTKLVAKISGQLYATELSHSPFDVVAWHGNLSPYRYELRRFCAVGPVIFDHPDPSIWTLLSSASDTAGTANMDFILFREHWRVAEHTFRPPWFHSNVMSELMGLVDGIYDAKAEGFLPGGISIHNSFIPHGPDEAAYESATQADLGPVKGPDSLAVMWESRYRWAPTSWAMALTELQADYPERWANLSREYD